ncbi:MAG: glycosyltransferase [Pseudomonadota bacterium]|nr:glycosyltransferase [Pseudomonadota bacterium]
MKLSIVTVCFNAELDLRNTFESVRAQDAKDFEYIVIDGGSVDGTKALIAEYEDIIDYYISEPDSGIYDAMNKGLRKCSGDFVHMLNAGDIYYDGASVRRILSALNEDDCVMLFPCVSGCGAMLRSYKGHFGKLLWESFGCHQGYVVSLKNTNNCFFNIKYSIKADRDLLLRLYLNGCKFRFVPGSPICTYDTGGVSNRNLVRKEIENIRISFSHKGAFKVKTLLFALGKVSVYGVTRAFNMDWKKIKKALGGK